MASGIWLGDSSFKGVSEEAKDLLKREFGLRYLRHVAFGGYSTHDLISRSGQIEQLMDQDPHCGHLFLSSRSNDPRDHEQGSVETRTFKLFDDYVNLIQDLHKRYPRLKIFALPQQRRFVSKRFDERFPQNSDPDYIRVQNEIISLFQKKMLSSKTLPYFHFCPSPPMEMWREIMADDGLHLIDVGKVKVIKHFCKEYKAPQMPQGEEFPPLPERSIPPGVSFFPFGPHKQIPVEKAPVWESKLWLGECRNREAKKVRYSNGSLLIGQNVYKIASKKKIATPRKIATPIETAIVCGGTII